MRSVWVKRSCLVTGILPAAIEAYPNETTGYVFGKSNRGYSSVSGTYAELTAERDEAEVGHGKKGACIRAVEYFSQLNGIRLTGGYHTHPDGRVRISKGDRHFLKGEMKTFRKRGLFTDNQWLELIIRIDRERRDGRKRRPSLWKLGERLRANFYRDGEVYRMRIAGFEVYPDRSSEEVNLNIYD